MRAACRFALIFGLVSAAFAGSTPMLQTALAQTALTQTLPPASHLAFVLLEFDVKDPAGFKDLAPKVRATLKDYKGEFVMREKVDSLFGGKASNLSVISFPTVADAKKWLASPEIAKMQPERDKIANVRTYLVEKMD